MGWPDGYEKCGPRKANSARGHLVFEHPRHLEKEIGIEPRAHAQDSASTQNNLDRIGAAGDRLGQGRAQRCARIVRA